MLSSQEQFDLVCEQMIKEGVPLTELNLMMRTELPKKTVAKMLKKFKKKPANEPVATKPPTDLVSVDDDVVVVIENKEEKPVVSSFVKEVLKQETLLEWFSSPVVPPKKNEETTPSRKEYFTGFGTGILLGPLGLFYSSPWVLAFGLSVLYGALLYIFYHIPVLGRTTLIPYLVLVAHVGSSLAGLFYTYKYNKLGKRVEL